MTSPRWAVACLAVCSLGASGCAQVEPPPGGPEDRTPPGLLLSRPDSLAVVPDWRGRVVFVFDERISEQGVRDAVAVSPRTSPVVVDHAGDEIRVALREGWRAGTIYHVTLTPGIRDLFGNRRVRPVELVFSTGPEIPSTVVEGVVVEATTRKPVPEARVEAVRLQDSLVYAVPADSAGRYRIARIPAGEYRVRAYRDLNRNRALDPFEPRDSLAQAVVSAEEPVSAPLALLMPDSTPPRLASVRAGTEAAPLRLEFDDYLDPTQPLPPERVQITGPAGPVAIERIRLGAGPPAGEAPPDTAAAPLPSQTLTVYLAEGVSLQPGAEYTVRARGLRNLLGLTGDSESVLRIPPAAPDTAAVRSAAPRSPRSTG